MEYKGLSKKALSVLRLNAGIAIGILLAFSIVGLSVLHSMGMTTLGIVLFCIVSVLCVGYFLIVPKFRHMRYKYFIGEDRVEIIEGILFISRTIVPIDRIHQIDIARGPIDNAFGVSKVIVTTAGSNAVFRFIELEKAELIAEQLNSIIRMKIEKKEVSGDVQ